MHRLVLCGDSHPPGYPFWAIYSWLWTKLLVVGNVAWRVEVGEATAAALACGLVALMVSRGSSMLMEGIEELKNITSKWETPSVWFQELLPACCLVLGASCGASQLPSIVFPLRRAWMMMVLICLMRWIYAPHQRGYLYTAMFFFGICATIHQLCWSRPWALRSRSPPPAKLGRDLFLGNSIVYILGLIANSLHFTNLLDTAPMVLIIYHTVGIGSFCAWIWLGLRTKGIATEWKAAILMGLLWLAGASFYFYEPIAGMTDPPMQWGYPRTVEGFFHALSRGQYEKASPSDVVHDPGRFIMQLGILVSDIATEFNWFWCSSPWFRFCFFSRCKSANVPGSLVWWPFTFVWVCC